jgi:uncharacterized protein YaiI (UPF0178 family)
MNIWIDGDACPKPIKDIVFRAAIKRSVLVILVANHLVAIPPSAFIKRVQVASGFDMADQYIESQLQAGDLVITADIILADKVISKQAHALNPRGSLYTENNMKQALANRHLNEALRESGLIRGGMEGINAKEIQNFSNHLDRMIAKAL